MKKQLVTVGILGFFCTAPIHGMVFDNRYFPLFQRPLTRHTDKLSNTLLQVDTFTASRSLNKQEETVPLFEMNGTYDQIGLVRTLLQNYPELPSSPFISSDDLANASSLPLRLHGRLDAQLVGLRYSQAVTKNIIVGIDTFWGHINSHGFATFKDKSALRPGELNSLLTENKHIHEFLKLSPPYFVANSWGDIDLSVRVGNWWDYTAKCKAIDAGVTFGAIVPTAKSQSPYNPASVPFGGNGHWGLYGSLDADFNLKDDWRFALLARVQKRLPKTALHRMPIGQEPPEYGIILGQAHVNPGITYIIMPTIMLDGLRDNFGIYLAYTVVIHKEDSWSDERPDKTIPVRLSCLQELSSWGSEYVTAGVTYDFSRERESTSCAHRGSLLVDIPLDYAVAKKSVKNFRVSLSFESNF